MKYLLLIYQNPRARELWESFSEAQRAEGLGAFAALNEDLAASGELIVSEALADPSMGTGVTVREGSTMTTDGPFAEAKEHLAGFYLVECGSAERATEIAAQIARLYDSGAEPIVLVEVRPTMHYDGLEM